MKKFLKLLILTTVLLLGLNQAALAFYEDVAKSHPYYQAIKTLYDLDKLPKDEKLQPDSILNKADFYKLLIAYSQTPLKTTIELPFQDTDENADYAKYLQTALDLNILKSQEKEFGPKNTLTKSYVLSNFFKTFGVGVNQFYPKDQLPFTDLDPDSFLAPTAYQASQLGILEKQTPKKYKASKKLTKAEAIYYLYKINQYSPTDSKIIIETSYANNQYSDAEKKLLDHDNFRVFLDIWSKLQTDYYYKEELDNKQLIISAIEGLVEPIKDKYTVFQKPEDAVVLLDTLSGELQGVGIIIEVIDKNITIIAPLKDSPAEKAGILANDIIIEVNDENVVGQNINYVASKIKGKAGIDVKIKVLRDQQEKTFTIKRDFILLKTVKEKIINQNNKKVAYIAIISFSEKTFDEFKKAVDAMLAEKADGFIIDLRNNPGGYFDVALNILNLFTEKSETVVTVKDAQGIAENFKTTGNGILAGKKIVVLVNEGSASAAEITAGALHDLKIAKLIGAKTFGKGSVQELKTYGDKSIFKYTISNWFTPNGSAINEIGITPDIVVTQKALEDSQLNAALNEF